MPQPTPKRVLAVLIAAVAAVGIYVFAHDAIGISRQLIAVGSFGSAGVLASALAIVSFAARFKC